MPHLKLAAVLLLLATPVQAASPASGDGGRADAERQLQSYLAIWSDDASVTAAAVDRFYAPSVSYYGQSFSRAQVLADKQAFIRAFPYRSYKEVPGTFAGSCNADRSLCRVTAEIAWRRTNRRGATLAGRSLIGFDFIPAEGGRKISRETGRTL